MASVSKPRFCHFSSGFGFEIVFVTVWLGISQDQENIGNVKKQLAKLFETSLRTTVPEESDVEPLVAACTAKFGDYQW